MVCIWGYIGFFINIVGSTRLLIVGQKAFQIIDFEKSNENSAYIRTKSYLN